MTTAEEWNTMPSLAHKNAPKQVRHLTELGSRRLFQFDEFKMIIREVMASADGRIMEAAEMLEVSPRQLFRWLADPRLKDIERAPMGKPRTKPETARKRRL